MPRKKREKTSDDAGAPAWMVTYGDMMTLLLCFFVMLVSLSEVKTEKFLRVLESLRRAFGYTEGRAALPGGDAEGKSPFDKFSYYESIRGDHLKQSRSHQRGQVGPDDQVKMVREGARSVVGARVGFPRGSAEISDRGREGLAEIADLIRGHSNKVEVRGHASREPLPRGSAFADKWDLAYGRARAAADFLIQQEVAADRIRIVACADAEPLRETYQTGQRWRNRRVEVLMMQATSDEFIGPPAPQQLTRRPRGGSLRG